MSAGRASFTALVEAAGRFLRGAGSIAGGAAAAMVCFCAGASLADVQQASLSLSSRAYVQIPTSPDFSLQQFTLSVWLKPTGAGENGGGTLVSKSGRPDSGSLLCSWWMGWQASTGKVLGLVVHEYGVSGRFVTSQASVALGQSAHAALTFDGVTLRLYINGVLDQQAAYGFSGVYYSTENVMVGAFNPSSGYTFNRFDGLLDGVSIWSRALSDTEVAALATCGTDDSAAGLVAHLPFTDSQLSDAAGHGHSGVAVGAIGFGQQVEASGSAPQVTSQPSSRAVCGTGSVPFSVAAAGGSGAFSYQWQIETSPGIWQALGNDPLPLPCGGGAFAYASPVNSPAVQIGVHACPGVDRYNVRCFVSNAGGCGSVASGVAQFLFTPADVGTTGGIPGHDGFYDNNDFIVFIDYFFAGDPHADLGRQGGVLGSDGTFDNNDFVVFIDQFFAGC